MKNIILFDDTIWEALLPLSYTKPVAELRLGITTLKEKWEYLFAGRASYITEDHLSKKYPINIENENILINGSFIPTRKLELLIRELEVNEAIIYNDELIAARLNKKQIQKMIDDNDVESINGIDISDNPEIVERIGSPMDIFRKNGVQIIKDFKQITAGRRSADLPDSNILIGPKENLFIEEGAVINACTLNTTKGPIYIGAKANVMEGALLRGPLAICSNAIIKMGAKIYGGTTIGPNCKAGGEIQNVVLQANSNKGHDGYLGNAVIGEWCNIGADSNASNLKNNYDEVKVWSYKSERFEKSGLQFCGLIMGDYSKCGINTMFNTGTVVGVSANIYGDGFPRNFIPSFSWGGPSGYQTYMLDKAIDTCKRVFERKNQTFTEGDEKILSHLFELTSKYRNWE